MRGFHRWFLHSYSVPPRLPDPDRLAVPIRPVVVGAAHALPCVSRVRLPPASTTRCDRPVVDIPAHPVDMRFVAHEVLFEEMGAEQRLVDLLDPGQLALLAWGEVLGFFQSA